MPKNKKNIKVFEMMEYYNKRLCLTISELMAGINMTYPCYNYHVLRGNIKVERQGKGLGNYALIDYDTLPERFKARFIENIGDPYKILAKETGSTFAFDSAAREYYTNYMFASGDCLTDDRIEEYVLNASMLNHIIRRIDEMKRLRRAGHNVRNEVNDVWTCMHKEVEAKREELGHTLPAKLPSLKNKLSAYKKGGYEVLISKKLGNKNTTKITEEGGRYLIALRRAQAPSYSFDEILSLYNDKATQAGWKQLKSVTAIHAYLDRPDVMQLWYSAVYGEVKAKQMFGRKNKTLMPTRRDSLWYGDGTKINLYYKANVGGKWVLRTTSVYEVVDAYSEVMLGYDISDSENYESQYNAFRMAIETAGRKPYEIVVDNQGGQKKLESQGFFEKICRVFRFSAARNPQSKSIEQLFGRFQQQILRKFLGFTGANITAQSGGDINMELILANVDKLPTYKELAGQYVSARQEWNNALHPNQEGQRLALYQSSINEAAEPLTDAMRVAMFWQTTEKTSQFTDSGITIQVNGKKYTYEPLTQDGMPDMLFRRQYTYADFYVKYDLADMSKVKLYQPTATGELKFIRDAKPYVVIHRAIQDQTDKERAKIAQLWEVNKYERIARELAATQIEQEAGLSLEQKGLRRPKMAGVSNRDYERIATKIVGKETTSTRDKVLSNLTIDQLTGGDYNEINTINKL